MNNNEHIAMDTPPFLSEHEQALIYYYINRLWLSICHFLVKFGKHGAQILTMMMVAKKKKEEEMRPVERIGPQHVPRVTQPDNQHSTPNTLVI
mmetsp:Transcript_26300/g.62538  ORF Transcript_26300/g.62538 Transcript_26300/m.62538 type:complete len:93 (+) Transcript_26300:1200-1478(+)